MNMKDPNSPLMQLMFKYKREFAKQGLSPEVAYMRAIEKMREEGKLKENETIQYKMTFKDFLMENNNE